MIKKYRKKPIVIEAMQWTGDQHRPMFDFLTGTEKRVMVVEGSTFRIYHTIENEVVLVIKTLEGEMTASFGDYIIKGVKGEFYPCKPGIFKATYEEV